MFLTQDFRVEPGELDTFAGKLSALVADHSQAGPYAGRWLTLADNAGGLMFPEMATKIGGLLAALESNLATLGTVTANSSAELTLSAEMYRTTDRARAAELDKTYVPTYAPETK